MTGMIQLSGSVKFCWVFGWGYWPGGWGARPRHGPAEKNSYESKVDPYWGSPVGHIGRSPPSWTVALQFGDRPVWVEDCHPAKCGSSAPRSHRH